MKFCSRCHRTFNDAFFFCTECGTELILCKDMAQPNDSVWVNRDNTLAKMQGHITKQSVIVLNTIAIIAFVVGTVFFVIGVIPGVLADESIIGDRGAVLLTGLTILSLAAEMLIIKKPIQLYGIKAISITQKIAIIINVLEFAVCIMAGMYNSLIIVRAIWLLVGCAGLSVTWVLRFVS